MSTDVEKIEFVTLDDRDIMPAFLEDILNYAKELKCSDIILSCDDYPGFRRNKKIQRNCFLRQLSESDIKTIMEYTMSLRDQEQLQSGALEIDYRFIDFDKTSYRINVFKKQNKFCMVMRIVQNRVLSLEDLQLPEKLYDLLNYRNGLILVVGSTGGGKSSTVRALIEKLNQTKEYHIITLEDPVEYLYMPKKSIISQREVYKDTACYADAIRAALREAPDVIFVGEMRDTETISATLTAAETGHLVLSTLHTTSAAKTIDRIIDVFPGDKQAQIRAQLASTLRAIICQTLIPTIDGEDMVPAIEVLLVNQAVSTYIKNNQKNMIESEMHSNTDMISMRESLDLLTRQGKIHPQLPEA